MKEGYSIIAYTDHSQYVSHNDLSDENFLAINSYEEDISDWAVKDSRFRRCYHFNCYDKDPDGKKDVLEPLPDYNDIDGINEYIARLNEAGFLVCYNHPNWSLQNLDDYGGLKGLFAAEIYNHSAVIDGIDGNQEIPYDNLLRAGNKLFCVATDDNHDVYDFDHPLNDSFGGFIWIKAPSLDYRAVIEALEKADKYKWHDLKENPDDLPEANRWGESNYVLVKALIKVECFACNDMRKAYYSHTQKKWSIDGHVFAWRYIEPFKDEECVFWMNDNI